MAALYYNEQQSTVGNIIMSYKLSTPSTKNKVLRGILCATIVSVMSLSSAFAGISFEPLKNDVQTPFVPGKYRALIIGNNQYMDPKQRWQPLNTAVSDAIAMENLLRQHYGFNDITRLQNASRKDILFALRELSQRVLPNDSVLIYYAGHGYLDQETQKGYWVPVDALGSDYTTYLRNSTIRDEIGIIADRTKHTLLISDSCFSGTLLRRGASFPSSGEDGAKYFKKVAEKKSVQVMSSGGFEYVDDNYKNSGHSPFTYFLINELKHNDKPMITLSELSTDVTKAVANHVDQTPSHRVLQGSVAELGEFIFVKIKVKGDVKGISPDKVKVDVDVEPATAVSGDAAKPTVDVSVQQQVPVVKPAAATPPGDVVTKKAEPVKPIVKPAPAFNPLPLPSL